MFPKCRVVKFYEIYVHHRITKFCVGLRIFFTLQRENIKIENGKKLLFCYSNYQLAENEKKRNYEEKMIMKKLLQSEAISAQASKQLNVENE